MWEGGGRVVEEMLLGGFRTEVDKYRAVFVLVGATKPDASRYLRALFPSSGFRS